MSYQTRVLLIENIQKLRGSIVLTYVTATRPGLESQITMNVISKTYRLLQDLGGKKQERIDLFIHSNGGDGIVPWKLVTLIREYCKEFNVIVPYRAFSAATLTAMGADNIYMHPMGMLGPTDPKVINEFNPNEENSSKKIGINVEDVFSYLSLVKEDVKITHEDELIKAWEFLAGEGRVHPLALGNVKRFYSQSRMMATKLLELHMDGTKEAHKVKEIADNLNSKLYFHGHPINRTEAKALGLKVESMTPKLEDAVWKLYLDYEEDMKLEQPFKPDFELRKASPSFPMLNPQQPTALSPATLKLVENATCVESASRSFILKAGFNVEGYRAFGQQGINDITTLSQISEEWEETEREVAEDKANVTKA
jgi:hypothetical protein